eukprot:TRINITY_DN2656_c0_g1_i2.p1 TRINITY_DN2656_c0_g1~~TRINITY_DN2656_c0_g1_i2.p1  ORF type:complete len:171 (+),score=46.31 TRINITY_DN2656_c0_g1_i2:132-644(+)
MEGNLFNPALITSSSSPQQQHLVWRPLRIDDFNKGYKQLLSQLTDTGSLSSSIFEMRFNEMSSLPDTYYIVVCEDTTTKTLVASGTLFVERKFIRGGGKSGHIEDIVVHKQARGLNLGLRLIEILNEVAKNVSCYKVILDCSEKNVPFYEKCGFSRKELQMANYFHDPKL